MLNCLANELIFKAIGIWLTLSGAVGFFAMGIDKDSAIYGEWRIREKTLFIIALAGGSFGMVMGSELFRHKTSKPGFLLILYAAAGAWLLVLHRISFLDCLISLIPHG